MLYPIELRVQVSVAGFRGTYGNAAVRPRQTPIVEKRRLRAFGGKSGGQPGGSSGTVVPVSAAR